MTIASRYPHGTLPANLAAFCEVLRRDLRFTIGPGEAADALLALDAVGVADRVRVRAALQLVLCATREQAAAFDAAFDAFFLPPTRGVLQTNLHARQTLPPPAAPPPRSADRPAPPPSQPAAAHEERADPLAGQSQRQLAVEDDPDADPAPRLLRARYSTLAAEGDAPEVPRAGLDAMLDAAGLLVRRLRLGRSRRWRPMPTGPRFDFRRTVRASLETGGESLQPRWQGHPRRNHRLVVIVDGSRSMGAHAGLMLQFAYALSQRARRVDAFVFSTELRDVTRQLRGFERGQSPQLTGLTEAWGGGTRIGECLERLLREHGHRCLSPHTVVFILSDGLDVGEPARLAQALRELRRRSAGLVWLNPLLGTTGYAPEAQGMRAALPYIDLFTAANDAQAFGALARTFSL